MSNALLSALLLCSSARGSLPLRRFESSLRIHQRFSVPAPLCSLPDVGWGGAEEDWFSSRACALRSVSNRALRSALRLALCSGASVYPLDPGSSTLLPDASFPASELLSMAVGLGHVSTLHFSVTVSGESGSFQKSEVWKLCGGSGDRARKQNPIETDPLDRNKQKRSDIGACWISGVSTTKPVTRGAQFTERGCLNMKVVKPEGVNPGCWQEGVITDGFV